MKKIIILTIPLFLILTSFFVLGSLTACDFTQGTDPNIGCIDINGDSLFDAVCDKSSGTTTYSDAITGTVCEPSTAAHLCIGTAPTHSAICIGDSLGLTVNTQKTPVDTCTATEKCEYLCDTDYQVSASGTTCEEVVGAVCGNNNIELPEECEGTNLNSKVCSDFDSANGITFTGGILECYPSGTANECTFDTNDCTACGDGIINGNEVCDCGGNACTLLELDSNDCTNELFATGTLGCSTNCLTLDTTNCYGSFTPCEDLSDVDEYYPTGRNQFLGSSVSGGLDAGPPPTPLSTSQIDTCVGSGTSTTVREWYCEDDYVRYSDILCPTTCTSDGTVGDYCTLLTTASATTCTDTDVKALYPNGNNSYTRGITSGINPNTGYDISKEDYCNEDGELVEFYCNPSTDPTNPAKEDVEFETIPCIPGYECSEADGICKVPGCGDGDVSGTEQCDDGDTDSGDGCSTACTREAGYTCSGEPSSCTLTGVPSGDCSPIGQKINVNTYCDSNGDIKFIKAISDSCTNDYECVDNMCSTSAICLSYDALQDAVCTYVDSDTLSGSKLSLYNSLCG